jgi:hypothetical protein
MYEIEKAKGGGLRPTTLRDAKKLNLYPSVTSIIRELATPNLTSWKEQEAVKTALANPPFGNETPEIYARRIVGMCAESLRERAAIGSQIHGAVEQAMLGEEYDPNYTPHVHAVEELLAGLGAYEWLAEKSFTDTALGFGGKVDAHSPAWVIDFKTKEFTTEKLPLTYENHWMQLGAYRKGLGIPDARGMIIYISINEPGLVHPVELNNDDLEFGYELFAALHEVWCRRRGYAPERL